MSYHVKLACLFVVVACSGQRSPPPQVRIDPAAMPILDAWADAIGGRDRIAQLGPVHGIGTCTLDGANGSFEFFTTPKGELRYSVTIDGVTYLTVFDGSRGWASDGQGVVDLPDAGLEAQLFPAFLESYSALLSGRRNGTIEHLAGDQIAIRPAGTSEPMMVTFDASHLPRRFEGPMARIVEITEWREFHGVKIASAWSSGTSSASDRFQVTVIDDRVAVYVRPTDAPR